MYFGGIAVSASRSIRSYRAKHLTPDAVKAHLEELMRKTGIHSRIALAAKASRLGVVVSEKERLEKPE